jgi:hypothetical protein
MAQTAEARHATISIRKGRKKKASSDEYVERQLRLRTVPDFMQVFSEEGSFKNAKDLRIKLSEYFDGLLASGRTPTASGMSLTLGFPTQSSLRKEAGRDDEIGLVLTAALTYLETIRNEDLLSGGPATTGIMFDLKNNHDWKDKTETVIEERTDSLTLLVQSLQGKVLRPKILIEEGEFTAVHDVMEPVGIPRYRAEDII